MTEPDLGERLRRLIDSGTPVTLDEVIERKQQPTAPRRGGGWGQLAPVLVAAGVLVAVLVIAVLPSHRTTRTLEPTDSASTSASASSITTPSVPVVTSLGTATSVASPTTSEPTQFPSMVVATSPPIAGCTIEKGRPGQSSGSFQPGDSWRCPVSPAQAEEVTGAAVPDPTTPNGYVPSYRPILYVAPGPISQAVYQRAWSPSGTFSPTSGATGPFVELRVRAHQTNGWGLSFPGHVTLKNGVQADGTLSLTTAGPSSNGFNELIWSSAGLDYELRTEGLTLQQILLVANSLP